MRENEHIVAQWEKKQARGREMCERSCHMNWQSEVVLFKLGVWKFRI
jgi:hypothetical protein